MPNSAISVPCQYRTGHTLGSGTFGIVKEAIHIQTGCSYACKVIHKRLMVGREHMVRNEIAALKRVSSRHPNIVTLYDYFETTDNLYFCFELCTGGRLFDRISARGHYQETDAVNLVRTIFKAVKYIHDCGIAHRDLKPENLIFSTTAEDADIMVADFGLSRIMAEQRLSILTEICGTHSYMAPEIFRRTGHGKPVDVWAMGVITYFMLAGYTPFNRDTRLEEMEAIIMGEYKFEPEEYWANVSDDARDFISECLIIDPGSRPVASEALAHKWLADDQAQLAPKPHTQKTFDAKKTFRKAVYVIIELNRVSVLAPHLGRDAQSLEQRMAKYKAESEQEIMDANVLVQHHHNSAASDPLSVTSTDQLKDVDDIFVSDYDSSYPPIDALGKNIPR